MKTQPFLLHALSPIHAGTGHAVDVIDLPIARQRATGIPFVPGSSLKGVLRERHRTTDPPDTWRAIFGPDTANASDHAGALVLGDAVLLALPVRSFKGTFAWVTSPLLLELAVRDLGGELAIPSVAATGARVGSESACLHGGILLLEDLDLPSTVDPLATAWAAWLGALLYPGKRLVEKRLAIVDDETMTFLWETRTQLDARVSIDDTGTLSGSGFDLPEILKRGVRAWMEGALEHGFFHGDVHAGNLMVDTDGNLVFLDFGIVGQLDDRTKSIIRNGLPALLLDGDFAEVAKSIYDLGAVLNPIDLDQASADIAEIVGPILAQPLSQISYGQVLIDIVRVGTRYEVRLPRELVLVAKQMLYFERYAKLMAPDWNILDDPELIGFLFESVQTEGTVS